MVVVFGFLNRMKMLSREVVVQCNFYCKDWSVGDERHVLKNDVLSFLKVDWGGR